MLNWCVCVCVYKDKLKTSVNFQKTPQIYYFGLNILIGIYQI